MKDISLNKENTLELKFKIFEILDNLMAPQLTSGTKIKACEVNRDDWNQIFGVVIIFYKKHILIRRKKRNEPIINNKIILHADDVSVEPLTISLDDVSEVWKVWDIVSKQVY